MILCKGDTKLYGKNPVVVRGCVQTPKIEKYGWWSDLFRKKEKIIPKEIVEILRISKTTIRKSCNGFEICKPYKFKKPQRPFLNYFVFSFSEPIGL